MSKRIQYSNQILDHFHDPRNVGPLDACTSVGEAGDSARGVIVKIFLQLEHGWIQKATFQTFGCVTSVAAASALTELVIGCSEEQAAAISVDELSLALGRVPDEKLYCCSLALNALRNGLVSAHEKENRS